jgi:sn-glycerol 3-phosphate transport system permease protein
MTDNLTISVGRRGVFAGRTWHLHVLSILCVLLIGFPLLYAVLVATQSNAEVFAFRLTPGSSFGEHFHKVWVERGIGRAMWNSLVMSTLVTVAKTVLSMAAGLAFVYFRFRGKSLVFFGVLITLMMPTEVMILALFRVTSDLGMTDSLWALVVPFAASATSVFLFRQHFMSLPAELPEAAQLDGAGPFQFCFRILLPLSWNTIGALAVVSFTYAWNMYLWPVLVIKDSSGQVVQQSLSALRATDQAISYGPLMLGALLASIPPLLVFLALQKPFMSGMAISDK